MYKAKTLTFIQTGLFFLLPVTGGRRAFRGPQPSVASKPVMLRPPKLHRKKYLSCPTSRHKLIEVMT